MISLRLSAWIALVFITILPLAAEDVAFSQGTPVQDEYALRAANGFRIHQQLDFSDFLVLDGELYVLGPPYSPRQTCGRCHDYDAITRAYHFRTGTGPAGENISDLWSQREEENTLYRYLAKSYAYLQSPGMYGSWCPVTYRQLAPKRWVGGEGAPVDVSGKPYLFDMGSFEQAALCMSCHPGGGPAQGIVQADGTVLSYDSPGLNATSQQDRDFYSYSSMDIVKASFADTIADAVSSAGSGTGPARSDWKRSGVAEADCMICHTDPESPYVLQCADGMKLFPNRPRMLIFAERDSSGNVTKISLGTPLAVGMENQTALSYTNHLHRMGRPAQRPDIWSLPDPVLQIFIQIWMAELKSIEAHSPLPYALYGRNIQKIWDPQTGTIRPEYCANPNGVEDEMARLAANEGALNDMFARLLAFLQHNGFPELDMDQLMDMLYSDFIYAYAIRHDLGLWGGTSADTLLPVPLPLRAYEPGRFYSDLDNPNASLRDYVRAPLVEGQGLPYVGRIGLAWSATLQALRGGNSTSEVLDAMFSGEEDFDGNVSGVLHQYLPSFFDVMPSAELAGVDLDQDGHPLCYVQLVREDDGNWTAKTYWEVDEVTYQSLHRAIFGGGNDVASTKWIRVCGQCHVMTRDEAGIGHVRMYNYGMPAEWERNGVFINETDDEEAAGYDVHMSPSGEGQLGCGACHLRQAAYHTSRDMEEVHNFLKGTNPGVMQRNDLDNAYRPKTCERCHFTDREGLNPESTLQAHKVRFGATTYRHLENIACQTCHVPFRKTWRFRSFDYTLGYYANYDNRMVYDVLPQGDGSLGTGLVTARYGPFALTPVYGMFPAYGAPHFGMNVQNIVADPQRGIEAMDFVIEMVEYLHMTREADPGAVMGGIPLNPNFDFYKYLYQRRLDQSVGEGVPVSYDPLWDNMSLPALYWVNGRNGYPQIISGNPVFTITWVDMNALGGNETLALNGGRMLYARELNAAVKEYQPPTIMGARASELAPIPPNADPASLGDLEAKAARVILKDSNYILYDHTGDMFPDLWYVEDVRAVQEALTNVLLAEGVTDPLPLLYMSGRLFSDTHGVLPARYSLGAASCNDCHNKIDDSTGLETSQTQPGDHRTTDRVITFLAWQPPWFDEVNRALVYDEGNVKFVSTAANGTDGNGAFFFMAPDISYVGPVNPNGIPVMGARAWEILNHSRKEAESRFYLNGSDLVRGDALPGINQVFLTDAEKDMVFVNQIFNGPDDLFLYDQVPLELKPHITELGVVPFAQRIEFRSGRHLYGGDAFVLRLGIEDGHYHGETIFLYLPLPEKPIRYQWALPMLVKQENPDSPWYRIDAGPWECARIVGAFPGYVKVKVYGAYGGAGRYAAVYAVPAVDNDHDGYADVVDCDDSNAAVHPGAVDICGDGGVDDDCDGVPAYVDVCGVCDENPDNDNETCTDCAGVPNGNTLFDACGVCGGDNSTCTDCAGVVNGRSIVDTCGVCVLPENACQMDCMGNWGGGNYTDNCGVCDDNASNDCVQDCAGNWGGNFTINECGHCVNGADANCTQDCGGEWHSPAVEVYYVNQCGECVNATTDACERDCAGVWGGTAYYDSCGLCAGGSTGREPCDTVIGNLVWQANDSGSPLLYADVFSSDGNDTCSRMVASGHDDWRLPTLEELKGIYNLATPNHHAAGLQGHLGPYWSSDTDEAGNPGRWGFDFSDNTTAFYYEEILYVRCVRCGGNGAYVDGCGVCDADPGNDNATCGDCAGIPYGSTEYDACGVCGGDNSTCTDCAGVLHGANVTDMCGRCVLPENACEQDCAGVWGGNATEDNCGVCDDNASNDCVQDCAGNWGGNFTINECGHCVNGADANCTRDCGGEWHSPDVEVYYVNQCGECVNATTDACERDCAGVWGGAAYFDSCGMCVGGDTGREPCEAEIGNLMWQGNDSGTPLYYDEVFYADGNDTCTRMVASGHDDWRLPTLEELRQIYSSTSANHFVQGLTGHLAPYWSSDVDESGNPGRMGLDFTDNTTALYFEEALYVRCVRCGGNGAYVDGCGVCDADPGNDNATCGDCAGIPYGSTEYDACGVCGGDNSTCTDCAGVLHGANVTDMCGRCVLPENACEQDCAGVWGGNATEDNCGVCDDNASNDCVQDCAGNWGGNFTINECGHCVNGADANCTQDCGGVWHSPDVEVYYVNQCGECVNATTDACERDCAGVWGGAAYFDSCGMCVGGDTGREPCEFIVGNLMWQGNDSGTPRSYNDVFDADGNSTCDRLVASHHDDWRLPTVAELHSIYDGTKPNHHIAGLVGHVAPYWSSESVDGNSTAQWGVDFTDNSTAVYDSEELYFRCVRTVE